VFGGGLLALLGLENGDSCSIASQPNQLISYTGDQGGKAQAVPTLNLCCFIPDHELAVWVLEGRLGFVTVAK